MSKKSKKKARYVFRKVVYLSGILILEANVALYHDITIRDSPVLEKQYDSSDQEYRTNGPYK